MASKVYVMDFQGRRFPENYICRDGQVLFCDIMKAFSMGEMNPGNLPAAKEIDQFKLRKKDDLTLSTGKKVTALMTQDPNDPVQPCRSPRLFYLIPAEQTLGSGVGLHVMVHREKEHGAIDVCEFKMVGESDIRDTEGNLTQEFTQTVRDIKNGNLIVVEDETGVSEFRFFKKGQIAKPGDKIAFQDIIQEHVKRSTTPVGAESFRYYRQNGRKTEFPA
jgi:hypothetical protein